MALDHATAQVRSIVRELSDDSVELTLSERSEQQIALDKLTKALLAHPDSGRDELLLATRAQSVQPPLFAGDFARVIQRSDHSEELKTEMLREIAGLPYQKAIGTLIANRAESRADPVTRARLLDAGEAEMALRFLGNFPEDLTPEELSRAIKKALGEEVKRHFPRRYPEEKAVQGLSARLGSAPKEDIVLDAESVARLLNSTSGDLRKEFMGLLPRIRVSEEKPSHRKTLSVSR